MTTIDLLKPDASVDAGLPAPRKISRKEYGVLIDHGCFEDERVELIDGAIYPMTPASAYHNHAIRTVGNLLVDHLPKTVQVDWQLDFAVSDYTQVEPDLAVIPRGIYIDDHPAEALLAVEVSWSSRRKDLRAKAAKYAEADIPEYWVFDLDKRAFVRHTDPTDDGYSTVETWPIDDPTSPASVTFLDVTIPFADVFCPLGDEKSD